MDKVRNTAFQVYDFIKDTVSKVDPKTAGSVAVGVAAAGAAVYVVPAAAAAVGFTKAGIAAGSWAASTMSWSWTTGVGMGLVSAGQSVGAAGLGAKGAALAGTAGYAVGRKVMSQENSAPEPEPKAKL